MSHEIPKTIPDTIDEVVAGYNKTTDVGEEISDEDVAEMRDVSEDTAGRQKKFLADIGVLDKNGYDYSLTEKGNELGELARFNQQEEAAKVYRELFDEWEPTEEILGHVGEDGLSLDGLANKVALVTVNELNSPRKQRGAETVVKLLERAGFLRQEDGVYRISENSEPDEKEETETYSTTDNAAERTSQPDVKSESPSSANGGVAGRQPSAQTGGVNISLDISGSDDPENVRQLLLAIRQGTQENVENYGHLDEDK